MRLARASRTWLIDVDHAGRIVQLSRVEAIALPAGAPPPLAHGAPGRSGAVRRAGAGRGVGYWSGR